MLKVVEGAEAGQESGALGAMTLDELAREGAKRMIAAALDEEVEAYLARHRGLRDEKGHAVVVRNGRARARKVTLGAGTVEVRAPRVNDRREDKRFRSSILPPYMRRSPKVSEALSILYLRGLSTGDFQDGLKVLLGKDAAGLSAANISRLIGVWEAEYEAFQKRDLSGVDYVYVWVDGIHLNVRLGEQDRICLLVMIGVRPDGTKELVAVEDGPRSETRSRTCTRSPPSSAGRRTTWGHMRRPCSLRVPGPSAPGRSAPTATSTRCWRPSSSPGAVGLRSWAWRWTT